MSDSKRQETDVQAASCLHLVLRPQVSALKDCLASCASGDCLVLMDAAAILLTGPPPKSAFPVEFCCLEPDVRAHGLLKLVSDSLWKLITDSELIERVVRHRHCLSWK